MSKKKSMNNGLAAVFGSGAKKPEGQTEGAEVPAKQPEPEATGPEAKAAAKPKARTAPAKTAANKKASAPAKGLKKASGAKKKPERAPGAAPEGKSKVSYYVDSEVLKAFKHLAVDKGSRDSHLVEEAMREYVRKHERKRA